MPDAFHTLRIDDNKEIIFFAVAPLYKEEMDLKLRAGTNRLLERMTKKRTGDAVDPCRPNAAKKLFGFL